MDEPDLTEVHTRHDLGQVLQLLRRRHAHQRGHSRLSLREIAEKTGCGTHGTVRNYLHGTTLPPTAALQRLLDLFNATPAEIRAIHEARRRLEANHEDRQPQQQPAPAPSSPELPHRGTARLRVYIAVVLAVVGLVAAAGLVSDRYPWSVPVVMLVVLVALGGTLLRSRRQGGGVNARDAQSSLRLAVTARWRSESIFRSLAPPGPMTVTWRSARPDLAAHEAVLRRAGANKIPQRGDNHEILDLFELSPCRQLVILGEPGAGKTALAIVLIRAIVDRYRDGELVPVLVSLTEWDPRAHELWTWFARRVEREFPALADRRRYGREPIQRLLAERIILPVLDGLDEMPLERQATALAGIRRAAEDGDPFVLTCRLDEYAAATKLDGRVLPTAVVVELQPVVPDDALTFLRHRSPNDERLRWEPVFDHIAEHPDSPLAKALSTPLMIWLADTVCGGNGAHPAQLLELEFTDRTEVERYLLDGYLPAAYPAQRMPGQPYVLADARRWLESLSNHLAGRQSRDLSWWNLAADLSRRFKLLLCLGFAGIAAIFAATLFGYLTTPVFAWLVAATIALLVSTALGIAGAPVRPARTGRFVTPTPSLVLHRVGVGIAPGLVGCVGVAPVTGTRFAVSLLVLGIMLGVLLALIGTPDPGRVSSPRELLRGDTAVAITLTVFGLIIGLLGGILAIVFDLALPPELVGLLPGIVSGGMAGAHLGNTRHRHRGPLAWAHPQAIAGAIAGGTVGGLLCLVAAQFANGPVIGGPATIAGGIAYGLFSGLVAAAIVTASPWLLAARLRYSISGELPWRLMDFLEDAHRRGVLRQFGATYQFRHATLQDMLASRGQSVAVLSRDLRAGEQL